MSALEDGCEFPLYAESTAYKHGCRCKRCVLYNATQRLNKKLKKEGMTPRKKNKKDDKTKCKKCNIDLQNPRRGRVCGFCREERYQQTHQRQRSEVHTT